MCEKSLLKKWFSLHGLERSKFVPTAAPCWNNALEVEAGLLAQHTPVFPHFSSPKSQSRDAGRFFQTGLTFAGLQNVCRARSCISEMSGLSLSLSLSLSLYLFIYLSHVLFLRVKRKRVEDHNTLRNLKEKTGNFCTSGNWFFVV